MWRRRRPICSISRVPGDRRRHPTDNQDPIIWSTCRSRPVRRRRQPTIPASTRKPWPCPTATPSSRRPTSHHILLNPKTDRRPSNNSCLCIIININSHLT